MIGRIVQQYVRHPLLRVTFIALWELSGVVLMYYVFFTGLEYGPTVLLALAMMVTGYFVMMMRTTRVKSYG